MSAKQFSATIDVLAIAVVAASRYHQHVVLVRFHLGAEIIAKKTEFLVNRNQ